MAESFVELIPSEPDIRVELAKTVRATQRLRTLLRLRLQIENDRHFIERLQQEMTPIHVTSDPGNSGVANG